MIGENNEQIGVLTSYEALKMAREAGVDLVEVSPNVRPPVCRLIDYGKWKYSQKKNVKKHHEQLLKEVRLRPKTDTHDREIKLRRAIKFLKEGHKVQFTMVFRGREQHHREIGYGIFRQLVEAFGTRTKIERPPGMEGRHMIMILSALKGALDGVDMVYPPPKAEKTAAPLGAVVTASAAAIHAAPAAAVSGAMAAAVPINVAPSADVNIAPSTGPNVAPSAGVIVAPAAAVPINVATTSAPAMSPAPASAAAVNVAPAPVAAINVAPAPAAPINVASAPAAAVAVNIAPPPATVTPSVANVPSASAAEPASVSSTQQ